VVLAKHLTKSDIDAIINIIHGHQQEKLTWDDICKSAENVVGKKPTRQSLNNNTAIKEAYLAKKEALKIKGITNPKPGSLSIAGERIARMQSEIDALKKKNDSLLEQFVVWQYNAYKYGMKEHQLYEQLPRIDRERTE
jgi:hypothetical protein